MRSRMAFVSAALVLAGAGVLLAQDVGGVLRSGPKVLHAFRPVVSGPSHSAVRVRSAGKDVALGTVVGADGWVLTKASVLPAGKAIDCRLKDGRTLSARLVGVQEPYDLALLKVDATGLVPIEWRDSTAGDVGRWVAS